MKNILKRFTACFVGIVMLMSCIAVSAQENPRVNGTLDFEDEALKLVIYVDVDGDDQNSGTIDEPLATMVGARDKIREMKKAGALPEGGAVVYFRGGTYEIKEGMIFTDEDSGTETGRITYRNYPGETVDFVGAESLSWDDFSKVTDENVLNKIVDESAREHIYSINLKEHGFTELSAPVWPGPYSYWSDLMKLLTPKYGITKPEEKTAELIINGKTMTIARYPNEGFMKIGEIIQAGWEPGSLMQDGKQTMDEDAPPTEFVVEDDRIKNWAGVEGAIMYGTFCYTWGSHATEVGSIDVEKSSIKAKYPMWYPSRIGQSFYVFNLIEEIDMPGEYYIDIESGNLYIYEPDFDVEEVAYTSLTDIMILLDGADNLTFKNINMKYMRDRAFQFNTNSENCELIGAEICYTSNTFATYVFGTNNKVLDCYYHDNDGGVEVSGGDRETLTRSNNLLENSTFERNDRLSSTYSAGVGITRCGNIVRNCDISDADHLLISYSGNYQEMSLCDVWGACMNADDMGALYAGRDITQRGNLIKNNYFHDIGGGEGVGSNGCHAIFLDDWWSAANIEGNVFAHIPDGCAVMLAGSYNVMHNNMVIDCMESFRLTRSFNYGNPDNFTVYQDKANAVPIKSEVWMNAFPGIENCIDEEGKPDMNNNIVVTNNVFYNSPLPTLSDQVAETAVVENNLELIKSPGFVRESQRNYLLKENARVYKEMPEFEPIPFDKVGVYSERAMDKIKDAYVVSLGSPFMFKNGEKVESNKTEAIVLNGTMYIPLRTGAEAVGALVEFNEATEGVYVSNGSKTIEFTSGGTKDTLNVNGEIYTLKKPVENIGYTNYISIEDLVDIFEKYLVTNEKSAIITPNDALFDEYDAGLIRYISEQLTIY